MTGLALLWLWACGGADEAGPRPTDPLAGEDIHYYEPGDVPEDLASSDGSDGSDPGNGDGTEPVYVGEFFLEGWTLEGAPAGSCAGDAVLRRGETQFTGTVSCEGTDGLADLGAMEAAVAGDAAGDGTLTLELETDRIRVILTGTFDDTSLYVEGEGPGQVGGQDLDLRGTLTCAQAGQ